MELICDLRRHMEQLYHEMAELRKSIKGCMDLQMTMQQSIKQEVHSGLNIYNSISFVHSSSFDPFIYIPTIP